MSSLPTKNILNTLNILKSLNIAVCFTTDDISSIEQLFEYFLNWWNWCLLLKSTGIFYLIYLSGYFLPTLCLPACLPPFTKQPSLLFNSAKIISSIRTILYHLYYDLFWTTFWISSFSAGIHENTLFLLPQLYKLFIFCWNTLSGQCPSSWVSSLDVNPFYHCWIYWRSPEFSW